VADRGQRRLGGWGFEGESFPPSAPLLAWLDARLGAATALPAGDPARLHVNPSRPLPALGAHVSLTPHDRLFHACGQGLPDLLRLRLGRVGRAPDAIVRPEGDAEVEAVLAACARAGAVVVPWGGGTSVTGGVNVPEGDRPVVSLDLERLAGVERLDETSGLATVGAGTLGPALEHALGARGFTLGHFPQSWELSSVGGWIVTRSSGQESLGYGSIADLVAGLTVLAPAGRLDLRAVPASAAGPDLRELVLGSEGRLGVVTRAALRVRPRPARVVALGFLVPAWEAGLEAARALVQGEARLTLIRLSDEPETQVAMTLGLSRLGAWAPLAHGWLTLRGMHDRGCLVLVGAAGSPRHVRREINGARALLRHFGAVGLGAGPGRTWLADRFRHPYLRDALLDRGIATDTLETAAPWSRVAGLARAVQVALTEALQRDGERVAVLCHVSHPYVDGASLYFTVFFRCPSDLDAAVARWATIKRAATAAIVAQGGTLSHHHGVGAWHAPWLEREIGATGMDLLRAAATRLDPAGVLNPHVLLDPLDRLER
jgi:alkyldihydroxyacetonephosphate synthase